MLYQNVRPQKFDEFIGNFSVVESLQKIVMQEPKDRPHALLFQGPSGCGKTTLARIFAAEIGCNTIDLLEINAANTRGIDTIRDIESGILSAPLVSESKMVVLDEAHQLTPQAQNSLLKIIEDCPLHVYFALCTTDPQKVITTVRNRCAAFSVLSLRKPGLISVLKNAISKEGLRGLSEEILEAISDAAGGSPRRALVMLEQIKDLDDPTVALDFVLNESASSTSIIDLCRELALSKKIQRWRTCLDMLKTVDLSDTERVRMAILGYLEKVLLDAKDPEKAARTAEIISIFESSTFSSGKAGLTRMVFDASLIE